MRLVNMNKQVNVMHATNLQMTLACCVTCDLCIMCNMLKRQPGLFKFGYRPVTRAVPSRPEWVRVTGDFDYGYDEDDGRFYIEWEHAFAADNDEVGRGVLLSLALSLCLSLCL